MTFSHWDFLLIIIVSALAVIIAYIEDPVKKTFLLMTPIPFTLAVLSLGNPVDATNVTALLILNLYYHFVRVLYSKLGVNIIVSIVIGAVCYCFIGAGLAQIIPAGDLSFWIFCFIVICVNCVLLKVLPNKKEEGNRTALPLYIKVPLTALVVLIIVIIKKQLSGFMTVFPMVGIFATYETRNSLWTTCRSVAILSITMTVMLIIIKLSQSFFPVGISLLFGWAGILTILVPHIGKKMKSEKSPKPL